MTSPVKSPLKTPSHAVPDERIGTAPGETPFTVVTLTPCKLVSSLKLMTSISPVPLPGSTGVALLITEIPPEVPL